MVLYEKDINNLKCIGNMQQLMLNASWKRFVVKIRTFEAFHTFFTDS